VAVDDQADAEQRSRLAPWRRTAAVVAIVGLVVGVTLVVIAVHRPDPSVVGRDDLGAEWPFTFESVRIHCRGDTVNAGVDLEASDGTVYRYLGPGYSDEDQAAFLRIWRPDPRDPNAKVDLGPFMGRVVARCGPGRVGHGPD
jgi:hypothetical protein